MQTAVTSGSVLAGFRVESLVGEGAIGVVYLARELATGRRVALKVLAPELARDERFRHRFLRESKLAAILDHPHIVRLYDAGDADGVLYLAMAYVEGSDLRELLRTQGRLDAERAIGILADVADALDAAHAAGLVHRDVKPANILLASAPDGERAFVCDFGLARHVSSATSLTTDRRLVGTLDYIPPEQIEGGEIDGRADVYSLACVLFECLAGSPPFDRESELSVVFAHLNDPAPAITSVRRELPPAFDEVFATALAKVPHERYSSCAELIRAARAALHGQTLRRRRTVGRRAVALGVAVLLAAAATVGGILASRGGPSRPGTPAITQTSIAGARLGMRRADYERVLGPAIVVNQQNEGQGGPGPGTGYPTLAFEQRKIWIFFPDGLGGRGKIIATWSPEYKTAAGVGPCSTLDDVKAAYGERLGPDEFARVPLGLFAYRVPPNLIFSLDTPRSPGPSKYVTALGIFDDSVPHAEDKDHGAHAFARFVIGFETPRCER